MNFLAELRRRNVFRTGIAYVLIAWVVLQIIDFMLELTDAPSWVLQVFFIAAAVGLPIVLIFSWVYEMTPEGLKRETEVERDDSITPQTGRKLDRLIIAALALVVVVLLAGRFLPEDDAAPVETAAIPVTAPELSAGPQADTDPAEAHAEDLPSIAVLPFVNMSPDPNQEYFADGISEEILNALARVQGLKVAGRTSSFVFKGQNQDLREIGEALGVEHILEGSVRSQGDRVRITAQLVHADDGFHLWSDTFDRELDDIFAIQDEIAIAVLQQTRIQLLDEQDITTRRVDPMAYQNYVAAKQRMHERTKPGLQVALKLLEDAVEIDPTFAAAWAQRGIATMLLSDGFGSYGDIPETDAQALGRQYLERALALDPDLAEAHAGLGLYWQSEPPFSAVERAKSAEHLERALAANPGLMNASHWLQRVYQTQGRYAESLEILESMVDRDPLYWPAVSNLVLFYVRQNRIERARELNDRTTRYRPELPFRQNAMILNAEGRDAEALPLIQEVWRERSDPLIYQTFAWVHYGLHDYATAVDAENAPDNDARVTGLAYLGRTEEAMMAAQRALRERGVPDPMITALTLAGRHDELVRFFRERFESPTAFYRERGNFGGYGYWPMVHLALAFAKTGEEAWYREAMDLVREEHERSRSQGFDTMALDMAEASYFALAGEPELAMEQIDRALAKGYGFTPRFSRLSPALAPLEGLSRYEEQEERALTHINEQRQLAGMAPLEGGF